MTRTLLLVAGLACVAAGAAQAGGWATVALSPPPGDVRAGEAWTASLTVLQHGRTPLSGVRPTVTIRNAVTGERRPFSARPTGRTGVYEAVVVFPSAGTWSYEVYDAFTRYGGAQTHTFAPVEVGPRTGPAGFPLWPVVGSLLGAAGFAGALALAWRRRPRGVRAAPAS